MNSTVKTCFKCSESKPLTEFYRHAQMGDGHLNKCKECAKRDAYESRHFLHRDRTLAYDRERAKFPERVSIAKRIQQEYKANFPERKRAQWLLRSAVLRGEVKKTHCFVCGSEHVEAHHPDYSAPLDVIWMCVDHHKETHALVHWIERKAA
jgi:hypothetical protein